VNLASSVAYVGGQTGEGWAQAVGADRRLAQTGCRWGRGCGQAKIVMSCQGCGLQGLMDGQAGKAVPPQSGVTYC